MKMVSNDYKTMAEMAVKYDICGFLKYHGRTEINTECLVPIATDIFKEDTEQIEKIRLYEAINRFSGVLFGRYNNITTVQRATTTAKFIQGVSKIYNLLVRLNKYKKYDEHRKVIYFIDEIDTLLRNVPNNIDYEKIATMIAELYLDTVIEMGCERALVALKSDSEEQSETN